MASVSLLKSPKRVGFWRGSGSIILYGEGRSPSSIRLSSLASIAGREVTDSEYPELKAMINRNENIRFFASYIFKGNVRYDYLGEFPTLSIDQARNKARYLARSNEDETAYEYIPF